MDTDTTRLRDAVERFADAPPAGEEPSPTPPPELMRALRRRRRRGGRLPAIVPALGAVLAVAAIVVGVVLGLAPAVTSPDQAPPVGSGPGLAGPVGAIPRDVEVPGDWIRTDQTPGVAAVVAPWSHGQLFGGTSYDGVAVVSAQTGEYTWLELPLAYAEQAAVSLSPTGRFLAYWTGESRARDANGLYLPDKVTELRVRDLVTGREVGFAPPDAPRGVSVDGEDFTWLDATRVSTTYGRVASVGALSESADGSFAVVLDAVTGEASENSGDQEFPPVYGFDGFVGAPLVAPTRPSSSDVVLLSPEGRVERRLSYPALRSSASGEVALNPGRTRFVATSRTARGSAGATSLRVAPAVPVGDPVEDPRVVPLDGIEVLVLLGWRDDDRVIAQALRLREDGRVVPRGFPIGAPIVQIDVRTGAWETVSRAPSIGGLDFADDLWTVPTMERDADADPTDPRLRGAIALVVLAVAGTVAAGVRRRRLERVRS